MAKPVTARTTFGSARSSFCPAKAEARAGSTFRPLKDQRFDDLIEFATRGARSLGRRSGGFAHLENMRFDVGRDQGGPHPCQGFAHFMSIPIDGPMPLAPFKTYVTEFFQPSDPPTHPA
jgi:hypothetical protein